MDKFAFDKINHYCGNYKKTVSQIERDYVIRKFSETYFSTVEEKKAANNVPSLTQQELEDIRNVMLNDGNLESIVISAGNYYEEIKGKFLSDYKKENRLKNFGVAVLTGITSNLIYSLVIIILFIVARDQISTWIGSLTD